MAIKIKKLRARRRHQQFGNLRHERLRYSLQRRRLLLKKRWVNLTTRLSRWLKDDPDIKTQGELF